jgi:putative transposase
MVIYRDADDFKTFERMLRSVARRFAWTMYAYCLMPTHYHVIVEARVDRLSRGMQRLNGLYARYFNARHGRTGALFQGRFHARVVDSDEYLARLSDYVPDNPLRAGLCSTRAEWVWAWSSFDS